MEVVGRGGVRPMDSRARCQKWQLWLTVMDGPDKRQRTRVFEGGKRAAEQALEAFRREVEAEVPNTDRFSDYAAQYVAWREQAGVRKGTLDGDRKAASVWSETAIGQMEMADIGPLDVQLALEELMAGRKGRPISGTTADFYMRKLRAMMSQAAAMELIARDPTRGVMMPRRDTKERRCLTPGQMDSLWGKLCRMPMDGYVMAVMLCLEAGLRRAEAVGLLESGMGPDALTVNVSKTEAGRGRAVPYSARLKAKVERWREMRPESEWWCCDSAGRRITPDMLSHWWDARKGKLLDEPLTLHELRHSNLSKMARYMGVHDLMRWAGWSTMGMATVYVHDDYSQLQAAVKAADGAV